jgi:hypothetical protein
LLIPGTNCKLLQRIYAREKVISGFEILEGDHPFLHCVVLYIAFVPAVVFPNTFGILDEDLGFLMLQGEEDDVVGNDRDK